MKSRLTTNEYCEGVLSGNRVRLAQAITLIESHHTEDRAQANALLNQVLPHTGKAMRLGITGAPGVGKSTFIESLGTHITTLDKRVAVLAIDPSSTQTKGSILGDKTRMESLSKNALAFIRPSASGAAAGGIATRTRECMLLCEAAGYDVVIVETVGVGQSESAVRNMVDFFLLLLLAGAGDELQGIKKGVIEIADALVITKADGDNLERALKAQSEYQHALHLLPTHDDKWRPEVLGCSSVTGRGIPEIWGMIERYEARTKSSGFHKRNREEQKSHWLKESFDQRIQDEIMHLTDLHQRMQWLQDQVKNDLITVGAAADQLFDAYRDAISGRSS